MTDGAKDKALADMGILAATHSTFESALADIDRMVQHILDYDSRNTSAKEVRAFCVKQLRILFNRNADEIRFN